jgi:hypothetical protein
MSKEEKDMQRKLAFENSPEKMAEAQKSIEEKQKKYALLNKKIQRDRELYREGIAFYHRNRRNIVLLEGVTTFAIWKVNDTYKIASTTLHPADVFCAKMQKSILGRRLMDPRFHSTLTINNPEIFEHLITNYFY